jgi:GT2 family glycosyltransferase
MKLELVESIKNYKLANCLEEMKTELLWSINSVDQMKDILIVVKDQHEYIQNCIDSIYQNTNNFNLFLWDNASDIETKQYLEHIDQTNDNCTLIRSEINQGFIKPNNELVKHAKSPYVILLNSDTEVLENWDTVLLGALQNDPKIGAVGYGGCLLDENFKGGNVSFNRNIDYVAGWCLCFSLDVYEKFSLFDEQFEFAYCEDADFGLRLKQAGFDLYAVNLDLVTHYENKTVKSLICTDQRMILQEYFKKNHEVLKKKWRNKGIAAF